MKKMILALLCVGLAIPAYAGATGLTVSNPQTDGNGVVSYDAASANNGPGTTTLRVLAPTSPAQVTHRFIYVLPVAPNAEDQRFVRGRARGAAGAERPQPLQRASHRAVLQGGAVVRRPRFRSRSPVRELPRERPRALGAGEPGRHRSGGALARRFEQVGVRRRHAAVPEPGRLQRGRGLGLPGRAAGHERVRHARQLRDGGEFPEQLSPDRCLDRRAQGAVPDGDAAVAVPRRRDVRRSRRRSWRRWTRSRGVCRPRASSSCGRAVRRASIRGRRAGCRRRWRRSRRCGTRPGTTSIERTAASARTGRRIRRGATARRSRATRSRLRCPTAARCSGTPGPSGRPVLPDQDHRRDRGLGRGLGPGQGLAGPGVLGGDQGATAPTSTRS